MPHTADSEAVSRLLRTLGSVFRGPERAVRLLATSFLAGGHVLLEDIPGVGKTTLGRCLALAIGGTFRRLQCTPDLMPTDITGVSMYEEHTKQFVFHHGPIFCEVLLADELNRTPPRTQSALLEAMNEGQVTVDGVSHKLSDLFFCVATQNPQDHVGTYPLPESQRDRFLLRFGMGYPSPERELELLCHDGAEQSLSQVRPVLDAATCRSLRAKVRGIRIEDSVRRYLLDVVAATRSARSLLQGASPRAALGLQRAAQAWALVAGREYVLPDDIQELAVPALAHRIVTRAGQDSQQAVEEAIEGVEVPR